VLIYRRRPAEHADTRYEGPVEPVASQEPPTLSAMRQKVISVPYTTVEAGSKSPQSSARRVVMYLTYGSAYSSLLGLRFVAMAGVPIGPCAAQGAPLYE